MADWGLQAIVGGSSKISMVDTEQQYCSSTMWGSMAQNDDDHNFLYAFPDGLEAFYKPFYPNISDSISTQKELKYEEEKVQEKLEIGKDQAATIVATDYSPKYKKSRKNQHKRVVMQVKVEDLSSDKWAWRKYGQKPIKGSIYPRSYYKCSSMKGCLARKQVEQICSDPSKYIITYTAEHCHSHPTRRNSLAGTVRNKFPTLPVIDHNTKSNDIYHPFTRSPLRTAKVEGCSTFSPSSSSLNMESSEEELSTRKVKQENFDDFTLSDIMMNDDFFAALEDFDGSSLESAIGNNYAEKIPGCDHL